MEKTAYLSTPLLATRGKMRLAGLSFSVLTLCMGLSAQAAIEGDRELLWAVATALENNIQSIETWQGSSHVESVREDLTGLMTREGNAFHFVYSRQHKATRWEWKSVSRYIRPRIHTDAALPSDTEPLSIAWANEMRKADAFYRYHLGRRLTDGERGGTLAIMPAAKAEEGVYSHSFDPMWYLNGEAAVGVADLAEFLHAFLPTRRRSELRARRAAQRAARGQSRAARTGDGCRDGRR